MAVAPLRARVSSLYGDTRETRKPVAPRDPPGRTTGPHRRSSRSTPGRPPQYPSLPSGPGEVKAAVGNKSLGRLKCLSKIDRLSRSRCDRQREAEGRALVGGAGDDDLAAVELNEQSRDHEPQPRAARVVRAAALGPEEARKKLRLLLG